MYEIETTRPSFTFKLTNAMEEDHGFLTLYADAITKLEPTGRPERFCVHFGTGFAHVDLEAGRVAEIYTALAAGYKAKAEAEAAPVTAIK